MQLKFIGAARTVTGSKHLVITKKGKKILLDCGLFQGRGSETDQMNRHFSFSPSEIDTLILSHAHMDHAGNIPNLVKQGFNGTILCTPATVDLCSVMLADSAHIQESDMRYLNKKRRKLSLPQINPLYDMDDVIKAMQLFQPVKIDSWYDVNEEVRFKFTDSGHIIGSAAVNLEIRENEKIIRLFFSGDIGRSHDLILKNPQPFPQADYIICESTYGNRLHEDNSQARQTLLDCVIKTCISKKGKLLIPAFSLGRTQEIVYTLDRFKTEGKLPPVRVFVDSPLSVNATNVMRKHPEGFNNEILNYMKKDPDPFGFNTLEYIQDVEESKALNSFNEPCIIISASGMIEAGRIKHHLKNNIEDGRNTVLIAGYCSPNSIGGKLTAGQKKVRIFGNEYDVKADVRVITSFSAHADYKEMQSYLSCQDISKVKKLFLVHGEYEVQQDFRNKLIQQGFISVEIPEEGNTFDLN